MAIKVRVVCTPAGSGPRPSNIEFEAPITLGLTVAEVEGAINHLLDTMDEFNLPAVGRRTPLHFVTRTVERITVWAEE